MVSHFFSYTVVYKREDIKLSRGVADTDDVNTSGGSIKGFSRILRYSIQP